MWYFKLWNMVWGWLLIGLVYFLKQCAWDTRLCWSSKYCMLSIKEIYTKKRHLWSHCLLAVQGRTLTTYSIYRTNNCRCVLASVIVLWLVQSLLVQKKSNLTALNNLNAKLKIIIIKLFTLFLVILSPAACLPTCLWKYYHYVSDYSLWIVRGKILLETIILWLLNKCRNTQWSVLIWHHCSHVFQTNPAGIELFSYENTFILFQ